MKNSKQLREEIAAQLDKAKALATAAVEAKRDLTDDEQKSYDAAVTQAEKLKAQLTQAEKVEALEAEFAAGRVTATVTGTQAREPQTDKSRAAGIVIPQANRYRHGKLVAYTGPNAEERAFIAGQFLLATLFNRPSAQAWCREHGIQNVHKESVNELGGVLTVEEFESAVIDLREKYGVFRAESHVVPMSSDTKRVPRATAGLTAYFGDEAPSSNMTESDKAWTNVNLVAKKLYAMTRYSSELSEDSVISIADDLTNEIAKAFAKKEDECGFLGDGTSTYGGMTGVTNALLAGSTVDAASTHTGFETLTMADFEKCVGRLPQYAEGNAKWYISKAGWAASMLRLLDAVGGNSLDNLTGSRPKMFLGYPVVITQVLNSTLGADASKPKAILGDLDMGTTLGNRRGMSVSLSEHYGFGTDTIAIRGTERFDINVHSTGTATDPGAIVLLKSAAS